jgi:hypothetical protein
MNTPLLSGTLSAVDVLVAMGLTIVAFVAWYVKRDSDLRRLRLTGKRVVAEVVERRLYVGGVEAMGAALGLLNHIVAAWRDPATGIEHRFQSEAFPYEVWRRYPMGTLIDVFIDPCDPGRYYMDVQTRSSKGSCNLSEIQNMNV